MGDRSISGLKACIASLDKIIGPVVEKSGDTLAREQLALMSKYLSFLTERLDYSRGRERFELHQYIVMGNEILAILGRANINHQELAASIESAQTSLSKPEAAAEELDRVGVSLRATISFIARGLIQAENKIRKEIESVIHHRSKSIFELRRAWFKPLAWEADQNAVPDLEKLLYGTAR